jgi:bifunctional DNase/RNase
MPAVRGEVGVSPVQLHAHHASSDLLGTPLLVTGARACTALMVTLCPGSVRSSGMTAVRIAHVEPWPGQRIGGGGFWVSSFLVVLTDDSRGRALAVWLDGPEGHGLFRGQDDHPHPEPAEAITAGLLRGAGVTVTGVDIDELDAELTARPRQGRGKPSATARIEFTAAGTAEPRQMTVRIGYALAMAAATGAPVRVADQLMDQLAVPSQDDLVGQFTRDVPLPRLGLTTPDPGSGPQLSPDL